MRKELMVISLAAAICGCGYDDGESDYLPALPQECQTDHACKVGSVMAGACVAGKCQRYCDTTDDCEENTVCESGLCRPVVACKEVMFNAGSDLAKKFNGKSCIQVFSHTPSNAWEVLRNGDIIFDRKFVEANGEPTDFTSDNYKFELPKKMLDTGTNFASVTFLVISYLTSLIDVGKSMYDCMKPQIYNRADKEYENIPGYSDDGYLDIANSPNSNIFNFSSFAFSSIGDSAADISSLINNIEALTALKESITAVHKACDTSNFEKYMEEYIKYYGIAEPEAGTANNIMMIDGRRYTEEDGETLSNGIDTYLKKVIKALSNPSVLATDTYDENNPIYTTNYFDETLDYGYHIKKGLKNKDLLSAVAKDYKYYIQEQCSDVVKKLELIAAFSDIFTVITMSKRNVGREWAEQLKNGIVQDYMYKEFERSGIYEQFDKLAQFKNQLSQDEELKKLLDNLNPDKNDYPSNVLKPISVCNEDYYDAVRGKNQANSNKILYCTKNDGVSDGSKIDEMYSVTYNMLKTVTANNLSVACHQALNIVLATQITSLLNGTGLLFPQCLGSNDLLEATLGDIVTISGNKQLNSISDFVSNLSDIDLNHIINPANLWIIGGQESPKEQNFVVVKNTSEFSSNDFIFSQKVTLTKPMMAITGDKGFVVTQKIDESNYITNTINKLNEDNYINFINTPEKMPCTDSACNFTFSIDKAEGGSFACGGVSYTLQNVSGYVVLNSTDKIGKRKVK